jgi:hypothetical protein
MTQALYAHINNKRKKKDLVEDGLKLGIAKGTIESPSWALLIFVILSIVGSFSYYLLFSLLWGYNSELTSTKHILVSVLLVCFSKR